MNFRFFAALTLLPGLLFADDWPCWRGPHGDGISREQNWSSVWPPEGPKQLWTANVGIGFSSLAIAGNRAFTLGNSNETDTVYAFDAGSGKPLWQYSYACPLDSRYYEGGPGATPTVDGELVYTLSKRGHLFAFEATTGKVRWQKDLLTELGAHKPTWGFAGSPARFDNLLLLNVGGGGTAVDKQTGKILWKSDTNAAGYATPVEYTRKPERAVALFSGKALLGIRVADGKPLWSRPWVTRWDINSVDPIVIGSQLFVSSFDRGSTLFDLASGEPVVRWENQNMANHFSSCIYREGYLYGFHGNTDQAEKQLRCIDAATGELKWKQDGLGLGSLSGASTKLIVVSERGELIVAEASPASFKPVARAQVIGGKCWTPPVLANGRIYVRNAQGKVVCLDVSGTRRP